MNEDREMAYPPEKANLKNCLLKRGDQIQRWHISDTNKASHLPRNAVRIKFRDGIMFLAACSSGDVDEVLRLIEGGADINSANIDGITALHQACIDNNRRIVNLLLEHGANINVCDNEGWTPLHATASCGFMDLAQYLIDHGARLDAVNNDGDLPIDVTDEKKLQSFLSDLMDKRGINGDVAKQAEELTMIRDAQHWLRTGFYDEQPHPKTGAFGLHIAAAKGYTKVIKLLLEAGADINTRDFDDWTPMHAAAHWGQEESSRVLAEHMACLTAVNKAGQMPIDIAAPEIKDLLEDLKNKQKSVISFTEDIHRPSVTGTRRSSIIRMSSDLKKDLITKTADKDVGLARATSVEEADEISRSDEEDGDEDREDTSVDSSAEDSTETTTLNQKNDESSRNRVNNLADTVSMSSGPEFVQPKKDITVEQVSKFESFNNKKTTDLISGSLSTTNKAVSLESLSQNVTRPASSVGSASEKPASSSTVADSKNWTSSGLSRNMTGGSERNLFEPSSRTPLSASSFRLSGSRENNATLTGNVSGPDLSSIKVPVSLSRASSSVTGTAAGLRHGLLCRQQKQITSGSLKGRLDELAKQRLVDSGSKNPIARPSVCRSLETLYGSEFASVEQDRDSGMLQRSASSLSRTSPTVKVGEEPLQRRPYTSIFTPTDAESKPRAVSMLDPMTTTDSSHATHPVSKVAGGISTSVAATTTGPASSLLTQLSYAQPSIESLRRRLEHTADLSSSGGTADEPESKPVSMTTGGHGHLLSSATVAALAALANTPRRSFDVPKRDEEKEVERKTKAKRARETRRSTQGVTKEDLVKAEEALQEANTGNSEEADSNVILSSQTIYGESVGDRFSRSSLLLSSEDNAPSRQAPEKNDADNVFESGTTTSASSTAPPYSRTSSYRSKYLQEKGQLEEARKKSVDVVPQPTPVVAEDVAGEKDDDDLSQKSASVRARRKRDRRSTGKVSADDMPVPDSDDEKEANCENDDATKLSDIKPIDANVTQTGHSLNASSSRVPTIETDYRLLYEAERASIELLKKRVGHLEQELDKSRSEIEAMNVRHSEKIHERHFTVLEKQAYERRIVDLEEQVKASETLKTDNQRLKEENGALIRVISKLSK